MQDNEIQDILATFADIIESYEIPKTVTESGKTRLKFTIYLKDTSSLSVYNALVELKNKFTYSYQWMQADKTLIICWDNAPHHPEISTHPYHQHIGTRANVQPSEPMTLRKVLAYIAKVMGVLFGMVLLVRFFYSFVVFSLKF